MKNEPWLNDEWNRLKIIHEQLDDNEFLKRFEPIYQTFLARKDYLNNCAKSLAQLYEKCRVFEIASGCNVFPEIMNSLGFDAVGIEGDTIAARYCRIKKKSFINPKNWNLPLWTQEKCDVLVLICYIAAPGETEWGKAATEFLIRNVSYQINQGADFVLFDCRYVELISKAFADISLDIERKHVTNGEAVFHLFYKKGGSNPYRKPSKWFKRFGRKSDKTIR